jgi:hypothetical protein
MSKGMDPEIDSYSAFHAADSSGTPLPNLLKILGVCADLYRRAGCGLLR